MLRMVDLTSAEAVDNEVLAVAAEPSERRDANLLSWILMNIPEFAQSEMHIQRRPDLATAMPNGDLLQC